MAAYFGNAPPPTLGLYPTFDKALEHGFIGMGLQPFKNWQNLIFLKKII